MKQELLNRLYYLLNNNNISVPFEEFKIQFLSHPDCPSLYAITETLNSFKIKNIAGKFSKNEIDMLPNNFLTVLNSSQFNGLQYVERINKDFCIKSDKNKALIIDKKTFLEQWKGLTLLVQSDEEQIHKRKINFDLVINTLPYLALLILISVNLISEHFLLIGITLLSIIGFFLNSLILKKEIGVDSTLTDKVCSNGQKVDCTKVITSSFKILDFSFNDLLFGFLAGQIATILSCGKGALFFLTSLYTIAFFFVLASIFIQNKVIKSWCTLCLLSGGVISLQFLGIILLSTSNYPNYEYSTFVKPLISFSSAFLVSILLFKKYKSLQIQNLKNSSLEIDYLKIKRNPNIFSFLWNKSEKVEELESTQDIVFGKFSSKKHIVLFLSLNCTHCVEIFNQFYDSFEELNSSDFKFSIRFKTNDLPRLINRKKVLHRLIDIFSSSKINTFLDALSYWYKIKDEEKWLLKYGEPSKNIINKAEKTLIEFNKWSGENNLLFTPIVLFNGRILPKEYSFNDFKYLKNIKELEV